MEVIGGGTYKLEVPMALHIMRVQKIRPYLQRFMYKRFVRGYDAPNRYVKTVMADNLNIDLGTMTVQLRKPAGYIQDFKALP